MIGKDKLAADFDNDVNGDSILAYLRDGAGNAIQSTGGALHVNVQNTITVSATDLDIRNLVFADDKVDVTGSSVSITGDVNVTQGTSPWVVSATDLDIRDLNSATDSVTSVLQVQYAEGSDFTAGDLGVLMLGVDDQGDYAQLSINSAGALLVAGEFTMDGQYLEDSPHTSSDVGIYNLAVRNDVPAINTSNDGDYASITTDAYNRQWVNTSANVAMTNGSASITDTSGLVVAAAAGRRKFILQNLGNRDLYFGANGVTATGATGGIRLAPKGSTIELEVGPNIAVHAVCETGNTTEVRYLQLA